MQTELFLPTSQRTVLVPISVFRAAHGVTAEAVITRIESGELLWVWDIGAHIASEPLCVYRLWARELMGPAPQTEIEEVLPCLLGESRQNFTRSQVGLILCSSRPTVKMLVDTGELAESQGFIPRATLESFFRRRWIGAAKTPEGRVTRAPISA